MAFKLPPLPYDVTALQPYISARTLEIHHGKHHQAYVANLNKLVDGGPSSAESLEDLIRDSAGKEDKASVFNNAAQIWNHTFFWSSMSPKGGGKPSGPIADRIDSDLGGYEKFATSFKNAATGQFGSGWAWLVIDAGKLKVTKTANADLPLAQGQKALLCIDVWEHAYYIDYQNRRPEFVDAFLEHLVNWEFANQNLD